MHKKIKIQDKSLLCSIYTWRLNMPRAHTAINHVIGLFIYICLVLSLWLINIAIINSAFKQWHNLIHTLKRSIYDWQIFNHTSIQRQRQIYRMKYRIQSLKTDSIEKKKIKTKQKSVTHICLLSVYTERGKYVEIIKRWFIIYLTWYV